MRRKLQMLLVALTLVFVPTADALNPEEPHCFPGSWRQDERKNWYCHVQPINQNCLTCFAIIVVEG